MVVVVVMVVLIKRVKSIPMTFKQPLKTLIAIDNLCTSRIADRVYIVPVRSRGGDNGGMRSRDVTIG